MRWLLGVALVMVLACADPMSPRGRYRPPPEPTTPTTPTTPTLPTDPTGPPRRHDCAGLDPADPAPLGGRVALTFDDGPTLDTTPDIVEVLRDHGAPATFFVVGEMLADPDRWPLVEEIAADPLFELGHHTWDHADMTSLSAADQAEEFDLATDLLETFGVSPRYFRFPYGASDCALVDEVRSRGMHVTGWHVDTADWCYAALGPTGTCDPVDYWRVPDEYADDMIGFTVEQVERFDGGIVLLHDIHPYTAATLDALLTRLADAGFTFTSLDDTEVFPRLHADDPVDLPYLGEACDPVADDCWQIEYQSWCEPTHPEDPTRRTGLCTLPCEGYCLDRPGAATTFCARVEPGAGQCVGREASQNAWCDDVPGTEPRVRSRFVGGSGAPPASASVCVPAEPGR